VSFFDSSDENNPLFNLSKIFGQDKSNDPWKSAADIAATIASEEGKEANVDPLSRNSIEDLTRVAELQVSQISSISLPHNVSVKSVSKADWSRESIKVYKPFFDRFGEALSTDRDNQVSSNDPMAAMLGEMIKGLGPIMVATTAGSMIGHLALSSLGQYDLPIPRKSNEILLVPQNISNFAESNNIAETELQLWVLIHEHITHSVLAKNHVSERLEALFIDFASAFTPNTELIQDQFGSIDDLSDFEGLGEDFTSPDAILSLMRSPAHDLLIPQIDALVSVVVGFVDYSMDQVCNGLVDSHAEIKEAIEHRYTDPNQADHFMERLLGIEINQQTLSRGRSFIDGLVERQGEEGLNKLWADELDLPTNAEVDAPGLWLERISYGKESTNKLFEVPDDISGLDDLE